MNKAPLTPFSICPVSIVEGMEFLKVLSLGEGFCEVSQSIKAAMANHIKSLRYE
jgi:hypothetical protein